MKLEKAVIEDKLKGVPNIEIGRKYGISFNSIEKIITQNIGINVSNLNRNKKVNQLQPKNFKEEGATVWSFKSRGNWATHNGEYRGNWSPYIPRNVIVKYSKENDIVLDYFCGAGTTAVECKLMNRNFIGIDINPKAIELAKDNIDFEDKNDSNLFESNIELRMGDARNLSFIKNDSIDLICSHPPYANIIAYTDNKKEDLSNLEIDDFLQQMEIVARESFRVLKPNGKCALLVGDMRRKKYIIPLGFKIIDAYLKAGFKLKELIIKRQHNCRSSGFWYSNSLKYNFLLLAHEYLPIFEKVEENKNFPLKEREIIYAKNHIDKKACSSGKLENMETSTVWNFPEDECEKLLIKNIFERYKNVIFIKYPKTREIQNILSQQLLKSHNNYFVIQIKDSKINGYTVPIAKEAIDSIKADGIKLKEIIIVNSENKESCHSELDNNELKIAHQYLLVYERVL